MRRQIHPLPSLSGGLTNETRALMAGGLALIVSALENRLHFRLFPFDMAWVAIVLCGWPSLAAALRRRSFGSEALLTIAAGICVLSGHVPAAGVLALSFRLALDRKDRAEEALRRRAEAPGASLPRYAREELRGRQRFVPVDSLRPGSVIRVLPGETVPVDGVVLSGTVSLSTAALDGAALPAGKQPGATVPGGAKALTGPFTMTVTAAAFDSAAQQRLRLRAEQLSAVLDRAERYAAAAAGLVLSAGLVIWLLTGQGLLSVSVLAAGAFAVPGTFTLASVPGGGFRRRALLRREIG